MRLNVIEKLIGCGFNGIWTHNQLLPKQTLNHLAKLPVSADTLYSRMWQSENTQQGCL